MAKKYIAHLYAGEGVNNAGLEGIELDECMWEITVAFSHPWDQEGGASIALGRTQLWRTFKLFHAHDADGLVEWVKDQILEESRAS